MGEKDAAIKEAADQPLRPPPADRRGPVRPVQAPPAQAAGPRADFDPLILVLTCNWCSYAAADLAGVSRFEYPHNVRVIKVMCSGMVHPDLVIHALLRGADGVFLVGCHPGDCHYQEGNLKAQARAEAVRLMLDDFGIDPRRFRLEWCSAAEGGRFAHLMSEMTETVRSLGPNPYRRAS